MHKLGAFGRKYAKKLFAGTHKSKQLFKSIRFSDQLNPGGHLRALCDLRIAADDGRQQQIHIGGAINRLIRNICV
jgi:hypothetical protein